MATSKIRKASKAQRISRLTRLYNYIKATPEHAFDYTQVIYKPKATGLRSWQTLNVSCGPASLARIKKNNWCGTTGCVGGHAIVLFAISGDRSREDMLEKAARYLGLDSDELYFLFIAECGIANRAAALRRLKWLIAGRSYTKYRMDNEEKVCKYGAFAPLSSED